MEDLLRSVFSWSIGGNNNLKQNKMKKETKLEIGKEYWLDKENGLVGIYIGRNRKNDAVFEVTRTNPNYDVAGKIRVGWDTSAYEPFIEPKPFSFTFPVAMKCTQSQFKEVRGRLEEMGYKISALDNFEVCIFLVNNLAGRNGEVSNLVKHDSSGYNRTVFEQWNPKLFLALAAMTDKEDGIKGEWWRYVADMKYPIVAQKYLGEFTVPNTAWRKATSSEIIEHFEKKEFVLPEKWCVKVTEGNSRDLEYWIRLHKDFDTDYTPIAGYVLSEPTKDRSYQEYHEDDCFLYTEITFDQFKKYVLKETAQPCHLYSCDNIQKIWDESAGYVSGNIIIPIPPKKQATIHENHVEISNWSPKEGEHCYVIFIGKRGFSFIPIGYNDNYSWSLRDGLITRTEQEAADLVTRIKSAIK